MDISKSLKSIKSITDYISNTHDLINKYSNSKIQFNMSTVLALKKIRSLEIEYFNKCDENGAAFKILDLMLRLPPSKTWSLLGIELVSLVQYWLDALRKHLIIHNHHWWNFLNPLLNFIQEIKLKDRSINNILVQETMECLLDLATDPHPDLVQRHRIIQCVNSCCADASREIRFALRNKFKNYFIKLSRILSSCGDVCTQYSIMETLLRWLLPRQDASLRREAAAEWFDDTLFPKQCIDIFLERPWHNFFKDARDFLNAYNQSSDQVTSIVCKHFSIGSIVLISEVEKKDFWLDLNAGSRCASLMLEPRLLGALGAAAATSDALVVSWGNVDTVQLHRNRSDVVIEMLVSDPKLIYPTGQILAREVNIVVDGECVLAKIDKALRTIYMDKYATLIDLEATGSRNEAGSENVCEVIECSVKSSSEPRRKGHSGFIVRPIVPVSWQSPSTASTSSLAMLRDKLTALAGFNFEKEPVSVCAAPQLSSVTELSETEDHSFNSVSTLKIRQYGVCRMRKKALPERSKCQSDGDVKRKKDSRNCISPIAEDEENSVSCLLVATIGSASDSVINDTLERLPKDKDIHTDNIVDLLAQEALQSKRGILDNKIDSNDKRVEFNPNVNDKNPILSKIITAEDSSKESKTKSTIISNTTTDESNTEVVEDTPTFVYARQNYTKSNNQGALDEKERAIKENSGFDNQVVENFFSQHLSENKNRELVISPSLARKINITSSEASDDLDFLPEVVDTDFNINDIDIIECLNDIVDKVCKDFDRCTEYLDMEEEIRDKLNMNNYTNIIDTVVSVSKSINDKSPQTFKETRKPIQGLRLTYTKKQSSKTPGKKKKEVMEFKPKRMSPIIERESILDKSHNRDASPIKVTRKSDVYDTPLIKRKRKLYSPKDDEKANEESARNSEIVREDLLSGLKIHEKTPKSIATCYKELENIRRNSIRKIRNKSAKANVLSPKSKKLNDAFDSLKTVTEGEKDIMLADRNTRNKAAVYNFTSDSEDEDFKTKSALRKYTNKTTVGNSETVKTARCDQPNTRGNKRSKNAPIGKIKQLNTKNSRARQTKQKKGPLKIIQEDKSNLIDERMREPAPEILNVSMVIENHKGIAEEPEPMFSKKPAMEIISDVEPVTELIETTIVQKKKPNKRNKKTNMTLKNKKNKKEVLELKPVERDTTESPLPGLVVEAMPLQKDPEDSILDGFNNISQLRDLSAVNTTHNLLSDIEPVNFSPPLDKSKKPSKKVDDDDRIEICQKSRKKNKNVPNLKEQNIVKSRYSPPLCLNLNNNAVINISDNSESIKTIVTIGKFPITAHGDVEEEPPNFLQLDQRILSPRELEVQDLSTSLKSYYRRLNEEIIASSTRTDSTDRNNNLETNEKVTKPVKSKIKHLSPNISITRLSQKQIDKWLPPRRNSVFDSNESSVSSEPRQRCVTPNESVAIFKNLKNAHTSAVVSGKQNSVEIRKSLISPIKLFDDFKPTKYSSADEDVNCKTPIKNAKKYKGKRSKDTSSSRLYRVVDTETKSRVQNNISSTSEKSTSTKIDSPIAKPPAKRKVVPDHDTMKRRKVENLGENVTESTPSVSSLVGWFAKNDQSSSNNVASRDESSEQLSLKDNIENVLEKLDTTLIEIHHNTSKKFVSLFLGAQRRLDEMKRERRQLCRAAASALLGQLLQLLDDKFTEIDRGSQEMDDAFMSSLKQQARTLIHEDCKQKKVMVTLLKEDVQAVLDHMTRGKKT